MCAAMCPGEVRGDVRGDVPGDVRGDAMCPELRASHRRPARGHAGRFAP
jgi:hypothetical protein